MNICVDVGNSTIVFGFYENNLLLGRMLFNTDINLTKPKFYRVFHHRYRESGLEYDHEVKSIIYSSVVPQIDDVVVSSLKEMFNIEPLLINENTKTDLVVDVDQPSEIGDDLIADLVGAKEKYGYPCLIADLGTASKILLLDKEGVFASCLIMPGLTLSAKSLSDKAALLPHTALNVPSSVLAKNTESAMNAGIIFGHADMISGLINRYEKEIGYPCQHILTGGGAEYVKKILGDGFIYDRDLNTDGLNIIINKNSK